MSPGWPWTTACRGCYIRRVGGWIWCVPHDLAQRDIEERANDVQEDVRKFIRSEATYGKINGTEDIPERECAEAKPEEVADALALLLYYFIGDLGASKLDRLLYLIFHPSFKQGVTMQMFTSTATLKEYVGEKLKNTTEDFERMGFRSLTVSITGKENCTLYWRDPVEVLRQQLMLSHSKNTVYEHVKETNRDGERIYNHPLSGKLAEEGFPRIVNALKGSLRDDICWDKSNNSFLGPVQLFSDKSVTTSSPKSLTFYPAQATFLNFTTQFKRELVQSGMTKVAFLPVYLDSSGNETKTTRPLRMKLLHRALEKAFENLEDAAWKSIGFKDANGIHRRCHPFLASYVTDIPEGKDLTCVLHGTSTSFPCTRCLVKTEDLALCSPSMENRTIADSLDVQTRVKEYRFSAAEATNEDERARYREKAMALLKSRSTTEQVPLFMRWPFLTLHPILDFYECLSYEPMHNLPLGVGKLIKICIPLRLSSKTLFSSELCTANGAPRSFSSIKNTVLRSVNFALKRIQSESATPGFQVDFSSGKSSSILNGFYTCDGIVGMLEAADFSCLDQVFPFIGALIDRLCGEVDQCPTTTVMTLYNEMVKGLRRFGMDPGYTEGDLKKLKCKIEQFKESARLVYADFQSSGMGTLKFHALEHVISDIERIGSLDSMDAGIYESSHREVKDHYRGTSRRKATVMDEVVRSISSNQALRRALEDDKKDESERMIARLYLGGKRRTRETSSPTLSKLEALKSGSASLAKRGERISYREISAYVKKKRSQMNSRLESEFSHCEEFRDSFSKDRLSTTDSFSKGLRDIIMDVSVHALEQFARLLREKACRGLVDFQSKRSVLDSLVIERVKSGFVAGLDTPTAENYDDDTENGARAFLIDNGRRTIQRIVCAHSFHSSKYPRQDCVILEAASDVERNDLNTTGRSFEAYFAKTLILFRAWASSGHLDRRRDVEREFVFLRYFDVVPLRDNIDRRLHCMKLKWSQMRYNNTSQCDSNQKRTPFYDIQNIATLRGRVQLIGGYYGLEKTKTYKKKKSWKEEWYYVNRFEYNTSNYTYYEEDR